MIDLIYSEENRLRSLIIETPLSRCTQFERCVGHLQNSSYSDKASIVLKA